MESFENLPGNLIRRMQQFAVATFASEIQAAGFELTPVQFATLATLQKHPNIEQATLAALVAQDRVTIGGVVSRLEARGLLERGMSETDRRARSLCLTERGETLLRTVLPAVRRAQKATLGNLSPSESQTLLTLLRKAIGDPHRPL